MARSPPGSVTVTLRSVRLVRAAAHRGGAGGRAAGAGEAGAALPGPHDQVIPRRHLCERNIRAVGKDRMMFQHRADLGEIIGGDVVDPEHGMGIAHADRRGGMQNRMIDRPDLQLDRPRITKLLGERDLVPAKARNTHVDRRGQRRVALGAGQEPRPGLHRQGRIPALLEQDVGDTAHAVAACAGLGAVVVVDAHEGVGSADSRGVHRHQLVVGHRGRRRAGLRSADRLRRGAHVDHHDLVAETVHFDKQMVGECAHASILQTRTALHARPALYGGNV